MKQAPLSSTNSSRPHPFGDVGADFKHADVNCMVDKVERYDYLSSNWNRDGYFRMKHEPESR